MINLNENENKFYHQERKSTISDNDSLISWENEYAGNCSLS